MIWILRDLDREGAFDLTLFKGAAPGRLDRSNVADATSVVEPGSSERDL